MGPADFVLDIPKVSHAKMEKKQRKKRKESIQDLPSFIDRGGEEHVMK